MEPGREFCLSDSQLDKLCEMMSFAFIEIRMLCNQGKTEQAADLAEAFHNLPKEMWTDPFDLLEYRNEFLEPYQKKYSGKSTRNYFDLATEIVLMGNPNHSVN